MKLYNTMTRTKEEFKPVTEGEVKMYSCGPTVYNYFHLGNARPFIVFDCLRNFFEYLGYKVTFVQNFTDVDDKLINKSKEEGITVREIADKYIKEYFTDAKGLGIREATIHPRATENIDAIIEIIETLIEKGHAYEVDGDVYFSVKSDPNYGKLSHKPLDDLMEGVRKDLEDGKRDAADFALWKKRKDNEIGWDSPWGIGRPGWHIECSAMVNKYLGKTIDIHSGGVDLVFPHHENEIAQSECANGCTFANYWMHNGFIKVNNEITSLPFVTLPKSMIMRLSVFSCFLLTTAVPLISQTSLWTVQRAAWRECTPALITLSSSLLMQMRVRLTMKSVKLWIPTRQSLLPLWRMTLTQPMQ